MKIEQLAQELADPIQFAAICWPEMRLYDKQAEVLASVSVNPETLVHAANKVGKTRVAAFAVLWWFFTRTPARVIGNRSVWQYGICQIVASKHKTDMKNKAKSNYVAYK